MLLDYSMHIPYYVRIKDYLLSLIRDSAPDTLIPGETSLASQFGVSRGTAKQAIMDLVSEGRLYRIQGKGTFTAPLRIPRSFDHLPTFTDDIRKMGFRSHSKTVYFGKTEAAEKIRNIFGLTSPIPVPLFSRLVELEEQPLVLVTSYLSPLIFPDLTLEDIHESLYKALLEKYGKAPVKAKDTYSIGKVPHDTARILHIAEGDSVFYSERISFLDDMTPVEYVESYIRGDRFKLDISIGFEDKTALGKGNTLTQREENSGATHYGIGFRNVITQSTPDK